MEIIIISIASTLTLSTLVWIIFFKNIQNKLTHENEKLSIELVNLRSNIEYEVGKKLNEKLDILNERIMELKNESINIERESYNKGKENALASFVNDYYVQVNPYKRISKDKKGMYIFSTKKEIIEIGYQYQLFVKGIPVFKRELILLETYDSSEFKLNKEEINNLVKLALAVSAPQAGPFIKVAEDIKLKE